MKHFLRSSLVAALMLAGCPERHRKEGDNHVGFLAGTNSKFFCVRNVKIYVTR